MKITLRTMTIVGVAVLLNVPAAAQTPPGPANLKVDIDVTALPNQKEQGGKNPTSQQEVAKAAKALLQRIVMHEKFMQQVLTSTASGGFDFGATNFKHRGGKKVSKASKAEIWHIVSRGIERNRTHYPSVNTNILSIKGDDKIEIVINPTPKPKRVVGSTALGSKEVNTAT